MRRHVGLRFAELLVLALPALLFAATDRASQEASPPPVPRGIELHVGIPDVAYLHQPLASLTEEFPDAQVTPFAGQKDAVVVKIATAGISCIAVGPPGDLKVASVGFNLDGADEGVAEGNFRTSKGIGKGSTVNDLLEVYGQPAEILGERQRGSQKQDVPPDHASVTQMYHYASEDGSVKTFFLIQNHRVRRIVVNDLAPLDQYIVKGSSKK